MFKKVTKLFKYENLIFEKVDKVALIKLNRPKALNALNKALCAEIGKAIQEVESSKDLKVAIITGEGPKSFVAGADIKEMSTQSFMDVYKNELFGELAILTKAKKPIIAAVNGFALGGGCELAMMCDIIIASENAKFGQPEIKLGTIPGIGGTQRLTKLIGKARAMEWILTGQIYTAKEALEAGLLSRIVPHDKLIEVSLQMAKEISNYSSPIVEFAKDTVNKSLEVGLTEGLAYETKVFQSTFATHDQKEGMLAFSEKRQAQFKDE